MRFLSKKQVRERVGIGPTQVARLEGAGRFPLRVHVGYRVFWLEEEIDAWQQARLNERPTDPPEREDKSDE
jgi:prophage regulatory protein